MAKQKRKPANFIEIGNLRNAIEEANPTLDMSGDCATWAMMLAAETAQIDIDYLQIVKDIINIKNVKRDEYDYHTQYWFDIHGAVPNELTMELSNRYFGEPFFKILPFGEFTLSRLSKSLKEVSIALVGTRNHITFVGSGIIYDCWNSTRQYVENILVLKREALSVRDIIQDLDRQYSIDRKYRGINDPDRALSAKESQILAEMQKRVDSDQVYRSIVHSLAKAKCERMALNLTSWKNLIAQHSLEITDENWMRMALNAFPIVVEDLVRDKVIRIMEKTERRHTSLILGTPSSIGILGSLNFD